MFDFSNVMALFKANVKETILNTVDVKNNTINIVEHYLNKFNSLGFGFFINLKPKNLVVHGEDTRLVFQSQAEKPRPTSCCFAPSRRGYKACFSNLILL